MRDSTSVKPVISATTSSCSPPPMNNWLKRSPSHGCSLRPLLMPPLRLVLPERCKFEGTAG